jgi:hypothetical protein
LIAGSCPNYVERIRKRKSTPEIARNVLKKFFQLNCFGNDEKDIETTCRLDLEVLGLLVISSSEIENVEGVVGHTVEIERCQDAIGAR